MSFIKVVDTVITQEIKPKVRNHQIVNIESLKENDKTAKRELLGLFYRFRACRPVNPLHVP